MLNLLAKGVATSNPIPPKPACESKPILENRRNVPGETVLDAGSVAKNPGRLCEPPSLPERSVTRINVPA
jgi:hypothetical protein